MTAVDLSHIIVPNMPVYPGTEPPLFTAACSIEEEGFVEKKITIYSHTGTHIDAPAHIIAGAKTLDQLPIDHFIGPAALLDLTSISKQTIDVPDVGPYRGLLKDIAFVLLRTGWSERWGTESYYTGYPVLSREAASWLGGFKLKGVGIDAISFDEPDSKDFPIHKILLAGSMILIENLTNLRMLPEDKFTLCCFPLKIDHADGSPVRAIALLPSDRSY
ncbi:MAG: cyclase family protein [Ignavibacteria bacterium]|nr:cyclase family protein [Ignavibacteria bacterium]